VFRVATTALNVAPNALITKQEDDATRKEITQFITFCLEDNESNTLKNVIAKPPRIAFINAICLNNSATCQSPPVQLWLQNLMDSAQYSN